MSLSGHLRELRNRILVVVILLLAAFTACLSFSPDFITFLTDMGAKYNYVFVYIAPQELLLVYLNTALVGALVICFPVVAYEVYAFCSPGLTKRERTFFIGSLLAGTLFFVVGVAFARYISLPSGPEDHDCGHFCPGRHHHPARRGLPDHGRAPDDPAL